MKLKWFQEPGSPKLAIDLRALVNEGAALEPNVKLK